VIRVLVAEGEQVKQRQPLVVLEAMKMETPLVSPYEGVVRKVHVAEGDRVAGGALVVELDESERVARARTTRRTFLDAARPAAARRRGRAQPDPRDRGTLRRRPDRYAEKRFWVGRRDGEPLAAAMRTPPYNLVLASRGRRRARGARPRDRGRAARRRRRAPRSTRSSAVGGRARGRAARARAQGVYALERVQPVPPRRSAHSRRR
jgi:pyruvate/2-oxoglutarate dehydrogenase complex dihydrolipoamide acyltransferase (E2) component